MTSARGPQLGSVIWAEVEDAHGFRKRRPAIIVTPTVDITTGKTLRVVAITTRLPHPLPEDHVMLPWDPQGKARSGLWRKCAAVVSWLAEITVDDVQQVMGILPASVLAEILTKMSTVNRLPD